MLLYYYKDPHGNFGDDLNAWLWEKLMPGCWDPSDGIAMSAIGTLISRRMPGAEHWIIFGSGTGYEAPPPDFGNSHWHAVSVRGPLTAKVLGLPAETAVTDGAILLSRLPECAPLPEEEREGIVFMPHHKTAEFGHWEEACERASIGYIAPEADCQESMQRLRSAKLVLADAMHAAIVADTLRVPWIPLITSPDINTFKWLDWTLSMEVPYQPVAIGTSSAQEALRGLRMGISGGHFLANPNEAAALTDYWRRFGWRNRLVRNTFGKAVGGTYLLARRTLDLGLASGLRSSIDTKLSVRAASRLLEAAAQSPSFLSEESVFHDRVKEMTTRIETVKELAENLRKET